MAVGLSIGGRIARCSFPFLFVITLIATAQQLIEVNSGADSFVLGTRNESVLATAKERCGPNATSSSTCSLRAACFYASSLVGIDVDISVDPGLSIHLAQSEAIEVSGPQSLTLNGNGGYVWGDGGDSPFQLDGDISVTFYNMSFISFYARSDGEEVMNGIVISADDPASSLHINSCTFNSASSFETGETRGVGGAVYSRGSLTIEYSTFSSNNFDFKDSSISSSQINPTSGTQSTGRYSGQTTPSPLAAGSPTAGNSWTPSPLAAGNSTAGNSWTPSPVAAGTVSTPSPAVTANFSTPSPLAAGNFTPSNSTEGNSTTYNVSAAHDGAAWPEFGPLTRVLQQGHYNDTTNFNYTGGYSSSSGTNFDNPEARTGAALYWNNSNMDPTKSLSITGCTFSGNSVIGHLGGAVVARGGEVEIRDTVFNQNLGTVGASLLVEGTNLTISGSSFRKNFAYEYGAGVVHLDNGSMNIIRTDFEFNSAEIGAGAVGISMSPGSSTFNLVYCKFLSNVAGAMGGGAVYVQGTAGSTGIATLSSPTFEGNSAAANGSIVSVACGHVKVESYLASDFEQDTEAFVIRKGFDACSSLTFIYAEEPSTSSEGDSSYSETAQPGPELVGARFSDTGTSIYLTFDQDTDYGEVTGIAGSFDCILLLDYPGVSNSDECSWASAASITATLHYNASVAPLDNLTALANMVALSGSSMSLNQASSVAIMPPDNPPEPQLVPEVWYTALAHCKDLVLDVSASTGAGGRVMKSYVWDLYQWTIEQESDAPSVELEYVAAASKAGGSSVLTVPAAERASQEEVTWLFNITATNWLGGVSWTTMEVLVSAASEDPPLLSLAGGAERTTLRAASLFIFAIAEVETCVTNKTTELTYVWSELRTSDSFTSTSADPSMFKLPPHSLEIGTSYEFRLDVTDSVGYSSFATQIITVESSSLIAAVSGGNSTVSGGTEVVLDLTATIDPDEENGVCQSCMYNVSCTGTSSGSACNLTLPGGETSDGTLTFQPEELVEGETYWLQISSRRTTDSSWSTTSTFFTVGGEVPLPVLSISPLSVEKVNADSAVAIEAEITLSEETGAEATWSLTEGVLDGYNDIGLAASSSLVYTSSGAGVMAANMVLSPNTLVPGSSYTFTLTAAYTSDGVGRRWLQEDNVADASSASISVLVNTPPSGGSFEVSPTEGIALTDAFELTTYAWEDDVSDLPLMYIFAYVSGSANESDTSTEMIVRAALESSKATDVYLPQGFGSNSTLYASVYAMDALGAASRATFGVEITAFEGTVEDMGSVVEDLATDALAAGDTDTAMQILDVASSTLNAANCTAAPDCGALNRDDCGTDGLREDNTCGECMSGTIGVMGPHNSLCVDTEEMDSSCSDSEKNGDETDIDCGGSSCTPCPSGSTCLVDSDCTYNNCPEPAVTTDDQVCVTPAKACPNGCGDATRGSCQHLSSTSGMKLNATQCLADAPSSTCRASCACFEGYGGDGCQYSDTELQTAIGVRQQSLSLIKNSAANLDISRDVISRQAALLSKICVVPEEMVDSSVDLVLELGRDMARLADESGEGVSDTAAMAMVQIIGQVTLSSSYLGEDSNVTALSDMIGSLISAQVSDKVVGQSADEISTDFFRISTGLYDPATLGTVQISPPLTAADESVGRSAPSIALPSEVGDAFAGLSGVSLAVAEWIIDPRQTGNTTASGDTNEVVSSVVRFYADPIEATSPQRRLHAFRHAPLPPGDELPRERQRGLLEDLGSLEIAIPSTVSQAWDPQDTITFIHECDWDSNEILSSTCPNGTEITTACTGTASTREVTCSNSGTEPECASWQGSDSSSGSASSQSCEVSSFNESWTTCVCSYAATVGDVGDGTGSNQVDFASTFLDTPGEFISIWNEVTTLTWGKVLSAAPIFSTMGGILLLAIIAAGFGWRFDQKDRGLPAGFMDWLSAMVSPVSLCYYCICSVRRTSSRPHRLSKNDERWPEREAQVDDIRKMGVTRDDKLEALAAAVQGGNWAKKRRGRESAPHHLGERHVKMNMKLLIMIHHDFVSVIYCFYEWFSRPQRVALLLCTVVTLMAAEATVFATIMFKDDGTCETFSSLADCVASTIDNVKVAGVGSSCEWDESSRTCYLPEPEEDMETSLVISTISLILMLPLEVLLVALFSAFIVRPTRTRTDAREGDSVLEDKGAAASDTRVARDITSVKNVNQPDAGDDLEARVKEELAVARAAEDKHEGNAGRIWRKLCCTCGVGGDEARREARLVKKIKKAMGPAITLEEKLTKAGSLEAQEALLFEQAEADSLNYLERQVFLKSRILNYGEEDDLSSVSWCVKCLAWLFVILYALGMSFYVCLFAVKAGSATSVQWMISFWIAFIEDIIILLPLKLAFIFLFLPSLMRHRMQSDMFSRIPRHATSVQVARRRPALEVSNLILKGTIPAGNEFEQFIPLFRPASCWYGCLAGLAFTTLAVIMLLPDTLQAMALDVLIAAGVGGGVLGLTRLFKMSFEGFVFFSLVTTTIMILLYLNHKRTMRNEKKLREARNSKDGFAHTIGSFSGVNIAIGRHSYQTPLHTPPRDRAPPDSGSPSAFRGPQSPTIHTESLAKWVGTVKPGSIHPILPQQAGSTTRTSRQSACRVKSIVSVGMMSEAGSRWEGENHVRLDSVAVSCRHRVHVSDTESSRQEEGDGDSSSGDFAHVLSERHSRSRSSGTSFHDHRDERGGAIDGGSGGASVDLGNITDLGSTYSTTFFNDLDAPAHRSKFTSGYMFGANDYNDHSHVFDDTSEHMLSPGRMTETASVVQTPPSHFCSPSRRGDASVDGQWRGGVGEMRRSNGSYPTNPAGSNPSDDRVSRYHQSPEPSLNRDFHLSREDSGQW